MLALWHLCNRKVSLFVLIGMLVGLPALADDVQLCSNSLDPSLDADVVIPACTRILEHLSDKTNAASAYNGRGIAKVRKGDLDSAIKDFDQALNQSPDFLDAIKNRGFAHKMQGDIDKAIEDFKLALRTAKAPNDKKDLFNLRGSCLLDKQEWDLAIGDFDQAIALDHNFVKGYINRGLAHFFKRNFDKALTDFDSAVRLAPNEPLGYSNRAMALLEKGDFEKAIKDYDSAIKLDPKNADFLIRRGEAWRFQGNLERSLADHNQALGLKASEEIYVNRALTLKDMGQLDKALADCNEAILLKPTYDNAYIVRGMIYRQMGRLGDSLRDLDKAISLSPRSPLAFTYRGETLREMNRIDPALIDFDKALQAAPDFAAAYVGRGLTYEKRGDTARAKQDFEKAVSLPPDVDATLTKPAIETAKHRLAAIAELQRSTESEALREREKAKESSPTLSKSEEALPDPGNRVALVIGNSAYHEVASLPNPKRDAQAMEGTFKKLGFTTVISAYDVSRKDLIASLRRFQEQMDQADWGVIYYAGHGIEIAGQNYLIPVDAKLSTDADVEDEAVSLERILRAMEGSKRLKLRVVMLDACRDNLFAKRMRRTLALSRSVDRGLAPIEPDQGTMVFYATRDGMTAEDGSGEHSPFTQALLNNIFKPKVEINMLFRRVRSEVMQTTAQKQEPFFYGSLPAESFYFAIK